MKTHRKRGTTMIALFVTLLLIVAAACGGGDDDASDDTVAPTATTQSGAAAADATATVPDASESATATQPDRGATTPTSPATATNDTATATSDTSAAATATESSGSTTPSTDGGFADIPDIETLDPELLPNFSMTMTFDATNLSGTPQTVLKMEMQQSAIDRYHLLMETDGDALELWTIGDKSWTTVAGETIESPGGPLFSPADILTTGELIPEGLEARDYEEISGRKTTKWVVDGADYVKYMNDESMVDDTTAIEMSDGTGEVTIWIDDELNIMIKADGDVAWTNSDDTAGSLVYEYLIHDIGSTAEVNAPQ